MWIPWVTSTWTISAKTTTATPYKKWNTTYVSKAAYDTLKKYESQLLALKNSNPTKFNTAMNTIKEKFIIK
jgi:thiaminase